MEAGFCSEAVEERAQPPLEGAPRHADGAGEVHRLKVAWSTDAGRTWRQAAVEGQGAGRFSALTRPVGRAGTAVWLRVAAVDHNGNTVTQTVDNAYTMG